MSIYDDILRAREMLMRPRAYEPDPPWIACITLCGEEPAPERYLNVCVGLGALLATSTNCEGTGCGGHPICRPCYELARADGLVQ